ncbi:MAG: signal peptidase I [Clostridia bacterium]|nr:signal peptidase I [Clostridia bacterium]
MDNKKNKESVSDIDDVYTEEESSITEEPDVQNNDDKIGEPSIESLLYDVDDDISPAASYKTEASFEDFFADYKAKISQALAMTKAKDGETADEGDTAIQESFDIPSPAIDDAVPVDIPSPEAEDATVEEDALTEAEPIQIAMDLGDTLYPQKDEEEDEELDVYNPEKPRFIDSVFEFVELFTLTLAAVFVITSFFFRHAIVDGGSMENTLHHEEHLIISDFLYTPERGDIIVFQDYSTGYKNALVKRVIAIEGDTVSVDMDGNVTVNGEALFEDYVYIDGAFPTGYYGRECVVPEGEVFVLGDHRNASSDSATFPDATISVDSILGKVLLRIYPFDSFGLVD